ncbi:hypothetical protein DFJ73DRAFT_861199 [Zopfochytrium polystomum]|nr:hypothetical protein DFJ73DRAFT_861199 [Zopfochytrium polystomum]
MSSAAPSLHQSSPKRFKWPTALPCMPEAWDVGDWDRLGPWTAKIDELMMQRRHGTPVAIAFAIATLAKSSEVDPKSATYSGSHRGPRGFKTPNRIDPSIDLSTFASVARSQEWVGRCNDRSLQCLLSTGLLDLGSVQSDALFFVLFLCPSRVSLLLSLSRRGLLLTMKALAQVCDSEKHKMLRVV